MAKEPPETVKTTMVLPRDLWKRAKNRAMDEGKDLNQVVIEALEAHLRGPAKR